MQRYIAVAALMVGGLFAGSLAVVVVLGAWWSAQAQDAKTLYPSMAPLEQYLMDPDSEIALARSAAPESISRDANVVVLGRHGYETAVEGKNGFVCAVERAWMSPFDGAEFWNPKIRGALCFNPPAARSILPITFTRTQMVLAGLSKAEIIDRTKAAYARKELPALEPGAMCYMMSKEAYLTDDDGHNVAHLMFYTPIMSGANWGADLPNSPVILGVHGGAAEPFTQFIVPVRRWSDGTPAQVK